MISIIITSFKEHKTIGRAIDSILNQKINYEYEILVVAPDEETAHASLQNVADILDRAYNRRTTLTSWIAYHVFKSYGFKEDDFEPIKNILKDPEFAKVFAEYKRRAEIDPLDAQRFLSGAFQGKGHF